MNDVVAKRRIKGLLELSDSVMTNEMCMAVANELTTNLPPIKTLMIGKQEDESADMSPIFHSLHHHPTLRKLYVECGTNTKLLSLGELLLYNSSIRMLYLWNSGSVLPDLSLIAAALRSNSSIRKLRIDGVMNDLTSVIEIMKVNSYLRDLRLYSNQIGDLSPIAAALQHNSSLEELDVIDNQLSDLSSIAEALRHNSSLRVLCLGNNNITNLNSLGEALIYNRSLEELRLESNRITDISPIGQALQYNTTLKLLDFDDNTIEDLSSLSEGLKHSPSLGVLSVECNPIADVTPICESLKFNSSLTNVYVDDWRVPEDSVAIMHDMLSRNSLNLPKRHATLFEIMMGELSPLE